MDRISAATFHHHLATMLEAGIALPDAIETAGRGTRGRWPAVATEWAAGCRNGQPLADVMRAGPRVASIDAALIAAGEASGDLPDMCRALAAWHQQLHHLIRRAVGRALYPALVIHLALVLPGVVLWLTASAPAWSMLVGPAVLWCSIGIGILILRGLGGRGALARVALKSPWSTVTWPIVATRTCRVLRAGVAAGMLHRDSLEMAGMGCGNRVIGERLQAAGAALDRGEHADLANALEQVGLPRQTVVALATADRAGSLDGELERQVSILDLQVAERLDWAARITNGVIYGAAVIVAVIAIISMMRGYVGLLNEAMGS